MNKSDYDKIQQEIDSGIVSLFYISKAMDTDCDIDSFSNLIDGYVYTVGNKHRNCPDIIVFTGPKETGTPINKEVMIDRINDAASLIAYCSNNWEKKPLSENVVYKTGSKKYGWTIQLFSDTELINDTKRLFMHKANEFYGTLNYDVIVIVPFE